MRARRLAMTAPRRRTLSHVRAPLWPRGLHSSRRSSPVLVGADVATCVLRSRVAIDVERLHSLWVGLVDDRRARLEMIVSRSDKPRVHAHIHVAGNSIRADV